jgi:very-short-patch-repair endonuclease
MKYNPAIVTAYFVGLGLPPFVREHVFDSRGGRKWRFDFAFLEHRIALEAEGGIWIGGGHSRGSGVVKDVEKYNCATLLGWRVLRCQPKDLCTVETVEMIKQMIAYIEGKVEIKKV